MFWQKSYRWDFRLGYCFTPYQRLWLYNGAPLVAFYDTLGIRRTYSRLKSRRPHLQIGTIPHKMTLFKFI